VAADRAEALTDVLQGAGETVTRIGHVQAGTGVAYKGKLL
jgi:phosphoribosylformylglycinamidine cyclo-ligase